MAVPIIATDTLGRTIDFSHSPGSSVNGTYPTAGSHSRPSAKTNTRSTPSQKLGTAMATLDPPCRTRSSHRPPLAAATPTSTPITTLMTVAAMAIDRVIGSLVATSPTADRPDCSESPKSPRTAPASQSPY